MRNRERSKEALFVFWCFRRSAKQTGGCLSHHNQLILRGKSSCCKKIATVSFLLPLLPGYHRSPPLFSSLLVFRAFLEGGKHHGVPFLPLSCLLCLLLYSALGSAGSEGGRAAAVRKRRRGKYCCLDPFASSSPSSPPLLSEERATVVVVYRERRRGEERRLLVSLSTSPVRSSSFIQSPILQVGRRKE